MRNLKKILALVLALVMSMSLMATAGAFEDEKDIDPTFDEAITVLSNLKVFQGYDDGKTFQPKGSITRAEVAAIIYRIATGDVEDKQVGIYADYKQFKDVKSTAWYAGYVNYCANAKLIKGYDANTFGPNDPVTGYQALAMILRAVGYDKNGEFTGTRWTVETAAVGKQLHITDNVTATTLNSNATREVVAEILFKAILVPQVTYTPALGYQSIGVTTGALGGIANNGNWVWTPAWLVDNASIGYETFGLQKFAGEITGVGYKKGITVLGGKQFANTDANWENIGYAAYVYAVPVNAKTNSYSAVSDVTITGTSLAESTGGKTIDTLTAGFKANTNKNGAADVHYYYNGYAVSVSDAVTSNFKAKMAGQNGVKLDVIDNDNDGKYDVITVVDYTVAQVNGVATDINTGVNAWEKDTYYVANLKTASGTDIFKLNTAGNFVWKNESRTAIKVADLVCADQLAYNNMVTYVEYNGDYYVTLMPYTSGEFTRINYNRVPGSNNEISYVIGGTEYVKGQAFLGDDNILNPANAKNSLTVVVGTDPYGYMLQVAEDAAVTNYLFTLANRHTDGILHYTDTVVAGADGAVSEITVSKAYNANSIALAPNFDFSNNDSRLVGHIFKYSAENTAVLKQDGVDVYNVNKNNVLNVTKATALLDTVSLRIDNKTVVVDLRDYLAGKADKGTVYTGYAEIPAVSGATGSYLAGNDGIIDLMFLTGGTNVSDNSDSFIVFHTGYNYYDGPTDTYYMDVVKDGQRVKDYAVSKEQYAEIRNYGIGLYTYNYSGVLTFKALNQVWDNVEWGNGIISTYEVVDGKRVYTGTWTDADDVTFTVINTDLANDGNKDHNANSVVSYNHIIGSNFIGGAPTQVVDTQAYIVTNRNNQAAHIYVILGTRAEIIPANQIGTTEFYTNANRTHITMWQKAPATLTNNLRLVEVLGKQIQATGKGTGTQADPFTYVAQFCDQELTGTAPRLRVMDNDVNAAMELWDSAVTSQIGEQTGIGEIADNDNKVTAQTKWMVKSAGVWYSVEVQVLSSTATLTTKDANAVKVDTNKIQIASNIADASDDEAAVLKALTDNLTVVGEMTYDHATKTVTVKPACAVVHDTHVATFTVEFVTSITNP